MEGLLRYGDLDEADGRGLATGNRSQAVRERRGKSNRAPCVIGVMYAAASIVRYVPRGFSVLR